MANRSTVRLEIPKIKIGAPSSPSLNLPPAPIESKIESPNPPTTIESKVDIAFTKKDYKLKLGSNCSICSKQFVAKSFNGDSNQDLSMEEDAKIGYHEIQRSTLRALCIHLNILEFLDAVSTNVNDEFNKFPLCSNCHNIASNLALLNAQVETLICEISALVDVIKTSINKTTFEYQEIGESSNPEPGRPDDNFKVDVEVNECIHRFRDLVLRNEGYLNIQSIDVEEVQDQIIHDENQQYGQEPELDFACIETVSTISLSEHPDELYKSGKNIGIAQFCPPSASPSPAFSPLSFYEESFSWKDIENGEDNDIESNFVINSVIPLKKKSNVIQKKEKVNPSSKQKNKSEIIEDKNRVVRQQLFKRNRHVTKNLPQIDQEGYRVMIQMGIPFRRVELHLERLKTTKDGNIIDPTNGQMISNKLAPSKQRLRKKMNDEQNTRKRLPHSSFLKTEVKIDLEDDDNNTIDYLPKNDLDYVPKEHLGLIRKNKQRLCTQASKISVTTSKQGIQLKKQKIMKHQSKPKWKTDEGKLMYNNTELKVNEAGIHVCGTCGKFSPNERSLINHIKESHSNTSSCNDRKSLKKLATWSKTITAKDGRIFYGDYEIKKTENGKFQCSICKKVLSQLSGIQIHIRFKHAKVPKKERPFQENKTLFKILDTPNGQKSYGSVEFEETESGKFRCLSALCGKKLFKTRERILRHIRTIHLKMYKQKAVLDPTAKPIVKSIRSEDGRVFHRGTELLSTQDGKYKCGSCNQILSSMSNLLSHIARLHNDVSGPYACKYCGETYGYKFLLQNHEMTHENVKSFVCEKCGKSFKHWNSLSHHIRQVHDNEKRHECATCGKKFYVTRDFIQHQRSHTKTGGNNFIICPTAGCGKKFVSTEVLKIHTLKKHSSANTNSCICPICGEMFINASVLSFHRKSKHKAKCSKDIEACNVESVEEMLASGVGPPILSRQDQISSDKTEGSGDLTFGIDSEPPELVPYY